MVLTHLPSNILLLLVPLVDDLYISSALVFARFSLGMMDVAPRQAYVSGWLAGWWVG